MPVESHEPRFRLDWPDGGRYNTEKFLADKSRIFISVPVHELTNMSEVGLLELSDWASRMPKDFPEERRRVSAALDQLEKVQPVLSVYGPDEGLYYIKLD